MKGKLNALDQQIVFLASLSKYKDYFATLILSKKLKRTQIRQNLPMILRLLSKNDEYLLMKLLTKHLFKGTADDETQSTLRNFFLGYCGSDDQTYEVSESNYKTPDKKSTKQLTTLMH